MQVREATSLILAISTASGRLSMASAREFKTEESRPYGRSHTGYRGVPQSFLRFRSQVVETLELRAPAECVPKPCALRTIGFPRAQFQNVMGAQYCSDRESLYSLPSPP